jgi:4-amino-4-deoxy-L-arabinose transferase-like glycosyltransferase
MDTSSTFSAAPFRTTRWSETEMALPPLTAKTPLVDIVIPVYNEEGTVTRSVRALEKYLTTQKVYRWRITIVDNASTDGTWALTRKLQKQSDMVTAVRLDRKGRGHALKFAWQESDADLLAYMDVDLSTKLEALPRLLAPLARGEAAIAIGSRLLPDSKVTRGPKREFISRCYNFLLRRSLDFPVCDAQCGFKAIRRDVAHELLPDIKDEAWFFDTELLTRAQRRSLPIAEIPVTWEDDPDSRVKIVSTAVGDLRGIDRLRQEEGRPPIWEWPLLTLLIVITALLYLVVLSKNGYGNDFYAAAVQAGTKSWKAFFFGSFDSANFITVDKPPFSLWVMEIFGRVFGFSKLSMLVPNALAGVASVFILQRTVRRWYGASAGLLAGLVLALTPVAVVMFRYNNPDAILTLLLVISGYYFSLALESGKTKWLLGVGVALGLAFISKMLQGLIILPIYAIVYLWLGKPAFWIRVKQVLWGGLALVLAGGWWPLIVGLIPTADRPYVGGSTNDSEWNLIFGYNGLGRISGNEGHGRGGDMAHAVADRASDANASGFGGAGGGFGGAFGGQTGLGRMFESQFGGQISWLLPLALFIVVVGIISRRGKPRTDLARAGYILWGGWVLINGAVFSFAQGIIHEYYSVVMAPAVGALVGAGLPLLWSLRTRKTGWVWPFAIVGSVIWAWVLLERTSTFVPWLHWTIAIAGGVAAIGWLVSVHRRSVALRTSLVSLGLLTLLAGPVAYDIQTVQAAHSGGQPTAGPATAGGFGGRGSANAAELAARFGGRGGAGMPGGFSGMPPGGFSERGFSRAGGFRRGGFAGAAGETYGAQMVENSAAGFATAFAAGGFGGGQTADPKLVAYLKAHMGDATWAAAISTTSAAGSLELALDAPVMGLGGFMGSDPAPASLAQFQSYIKEGKLKYVIVSAGRTGDTVEGVKPTNQPGIAAGFSFAGFGGGSNSVQSAIQAWVVAHGTKVNYGGTGSTLYQVTPASL